MKIFSSSKPISSPGRVDKFPSPLMMRFLRSNVGSRSSRGRSRASPMFFRKKTTAAIETQEPSSPKVTCIGQVRVRRSKKRGSKNAKKSRKCTGNNRCYCVRKPSLFNSIKMKLKWICFYNSTSVRVRTNSSEKRTKEHSSDEEDEESKNQSVLDEEDEEIERESRFEVCNSNPPKNALLLTRCRSAPYRSSSLACRFWEEAAQKTEQEDRERSIDLKNEPICRDSTSESRGDREQEGNLGICALIEGSIETLEVKSEDENGGITPLPMPLVLMRCKSEPARRCSEEFDPQTSKFWRHRRRLGNYNIDF